MQQKCFCSTTYMCIATDRQTDAYRDTDTDTDTHTKYTLNAQTDWQRHSQDDTQKDRHRHCNH